MPAPGTRLPSLALYDRPFHGTYAKNQDSLGSRPKQRRSWLRCGNRPGTLPRSFRDVMLPSNARQLTNRHQRPECHSL